MSETNVKTTRAAAYEEYQSAEMEAMRLARSYRLMAKAHVDAGQRAMSINPSRYFDVANAIEATSHAFENLEGALCPEDVGIVEHVESLEARLAAAEERAEKMHRRAQQAESRVAHEVEPLKARLQDAEEFGQERHRLTIVLREKLAAAEEREQVLVGLLRRLLDDPHGCQMCDYGKLRKSAIDKGHQPDCTWDAARAALAPATTGDAQGE